MTSDERKRELARVLLYEHMILQGSGDDMARMLSDNVGDELLMDTYWPCMERLLERARLRLQSLPDVREDRVREFRGLGHD